MTWLASSWMENLRPSSEEKDPMGERVPEVSTMLCAAVPRSENACQSVHTQTYHEQATNYINSKILIYINIFFSLFSLH